MKKKKRKSNTENIYIIAERTWKIFRIFTYSILCAFVYMFYVWYKVSNLFARSYDSYKFFGAHWFEYCVSLSFIMEVASWLFYITSFVAFFFRTHHTIFLSNFLFLRRTWCMTHSFAFIIQCLFIFFSVFVCFECFIISFCLSFIP